MAAGQDSGARRCAFEAVLGDIHGVLDVNGVLTAWDFFRHNDIAMNAPKVQCPMAGDVVLYVTARKRNVVGGNLSDEMLNIAVIVFIVRGVLSDLSAILGSP
jgi:hypothetical protein